MDVSFNDLFKTYFISLLKTKTIYIFIIIIRYEMSKYYHKPRMKGQIIIKQQRFYLIKQLLVC